MKQEKSIELFYAYAHEDRILRRKLESHLGNLKQQGLIATWHDRQIHAGKDWRQEIEAHLNNAQIILLLVSANFLSSDYCYGIEMKRAMERHETGEARVVPIILRPVDWKDTPFSRLQALPTQGKPVTSWSNRDQAFLDIAQGIRNIIEEITSLSSSFSQRNLQAFSQIMRRDDCKKLNIFEPPQEFEIIKSALNVHKIAILVGEPWTGKTFTALRLLYDYFLQGYKVLWLPSFAESLQELTDQSVSFLRNHPHTIIYLEDPFGRENISRSAERMANSLQYILGALHDEDQNIYLIMTSWKYPFYNVLDSKLVLSDIKRKQILIEFNNESYAREQLINILIGSLEYNKYLANQEQKDQFVNVIIPRLTRPGQIEDVVIRGKAEQNLNRLVEIVEEVANVDEALPAEIMHMSPEELAMITACYIYQDNPIDWVEACCQLAMAKLRQANVPVSVAAKQFFEENILRLLQYDWLRLVPFSETRILQFGHTTRATAFRQSLKRYISVRANVLAIVDGLLEEPSPSVLIDLIEFLIASIDMIYPSDTIIHRPDLERLNRRLSSFLKKGTSVKGELAYSITGYIGRYQEHYAVRQILADILNILSIDPDWQVRGMVAGAIAENFQILPKDVQVIFDKLSIDADPWVRFLVAEALVWRITNLPQHYEEVFEALVVDKHPGVRGFLADTFCYVYNLDEVAQRVHARELLHNYVADTDPTVVGWVLFGTLFHRDAMPDKLVDDVLTNVMSRNIHEETEHAFADATRYHMSYLQVHSILRHRQDMLRKFLAGATALQQSLYRGSTQLLPMAKPFSPKSIVVLKNLAASGNPEVRAGVLFIAIAHGKSDSPEIEQTVYQLLDDGKLQTCELAQSIASFFQLHFKLTFKLNEPQQPLRGGC